VVLKKSEQRFVNQSSEKIRAAKKIRAAIVVELNNKD